MPALAELLKTLATWSVSMKSGCLLSPWICVQGWILPWLRYLKPSAASVKPHCVYLFCNKCGHRMKVLVHDGLDIWLCARRLEQGKYFRPAQFYKEQHIRGKWVCDQCETTKQEPMPAYVIDKGILHLNCWAMYWFLNMRIICHCTISTWSTGAGCRASKTRKR